MEFAHEHDDASAFMQTIANTSSGCGHFDHRGSTHIGYRSIPSGLKYWYRRAVQVISV